MLVFLSGIIASMAHVVTGPDHLAAVTPLAISSKKKSWAIGLSWGLGHVTGMLMIGAVFLLFRDLLPVEAISSHSEVIIGILLVIIGLWAILRLYLNSHFGHHVHLHFHPGPMPYLHVHKHDHSVKATHEHEHPQPVRQKGIAALGIGVVHGLAGFSHLVAVLPSLALPTWNDTFWYLGGFSIGTISTMVLFSVPLGMFAQKLAKEHKNKLLTIVSLTGGILAIAVGIMWLLRSF